jgi:CheY-like chemotaxis protein
MAMNSMSRRIDLLLVDDRAADADVTLFAIKRAAPQARVLWLRNGNLALDYLLGIGAANAVLNKAPQLVLLSGEMKVLSGPFVLDVIRAHPRTSNLPVIMIGESEVSRIIARRDRFSADEYVRRSPDPDEYCAQIGQLIERWLHGPSVSRSSPFRMLTAMTNASGVALR